MANYGLITVLTVMVAALLLRIVQSYAAQTAARGTAILTVDALNMMLIALLVFLVLRQVMPVAAGLAGGARSTPSVWLIAVLSWAARKTTAWRFRPLYGRLLRQTALVLPLTDGGRAMRAVAARTSVGLQTLARGWRNWNR